MQRARRLRPALAVAAGLAAALLVVQAIGLQPVYSQEEKAPEAKAEADTAITAIPIKDLPKSSQQADELIYAMKSRLAADSTLLGIADLLPSATGRVDSLCSRSEGLLTSKPTLRRLRNLQGDWQDLIANISQWQTALAARISDISGDLSELTRLRQSWEMTEARAGEERLPTEVSTAISRTVSKLRETENLLFERRNQLLLLEYRVTELGARCRRRIDLAKAEAERISNRLLVADTAPLWDPHVLSEADQHMGLKITATLGDHARSIWAYVAANPGRMGLHLLIFMAAAILIALLARYAGARSEEDPSLEHAAGILKSSIAGAFLVAILVDAPLHPSPPDSWALLLNLLLLVPMLTLGPRLLNARVRFSVYVIAGVYLLDGVLEVLPQHSFTGRLLRLAIKVILIITALRLLRRIYLPGGMSHGHRRTIVTLALGAATGVLVASAVAGILGNESLALVLLDGTLDTAYLGLLLWLTVMVIRSIVIVILATGLVRRTNLMTKHGDALRRGILAAITIGGAVAWLIVALEGFKLLGPVYDGTKHILTSKFNVGSLGIAIGDIVLFFLIIWLSFLVSRIIRTILREEVYPRVRMAHGVPMAISKLTHYGIVVIGFFLALGAAGIDLNRFTLLAGAMGVGIGFGLQNIVSNLVSGIIVLFERPVQTGDKVRIGTNEGEIKRIGLRATVIRTWEGSEVIVPNSRLVLEEVTNWTLSDQMRRVDILVGVAYGSDTDKVSQVLLKVAKDHEDVLDYPEPTVLFSSFGDSSLNFSLRAWTNRFGDFLRVGSELTSGVNKALAEAGITIPFPQRDLHLKSGFKPGELDIPGGEK